MWPGPVPPAERIATIDVLRGFALFGVLLINMRNFDLTGQVWTGTADRVALWFVLGLGDSKFWTIFSFLFGLGFSLQMQRAAAKGVHFASYYSRRLLVLLCLGILHFFLYFGDILYDYALVGFLLLLVRRRSTQTIVVLATLSFLIPPAYHIYRLRQLELQNTNPRTAQIAALRQAKEDTRGRQADVILSKGSFSSILRSRLDYFPRARLRIGHYLWDYGGPMGGILSLFLFGMLIGRWHFFERVDTYGPLLRKTFGVGLVIGLICTVVSMTGSWPNAILPYETPSWRGLLWYIGTPALSLAYASGIILLCQESTWKRRLGPLAALGRTALSNYLLQSLIFSTIFLGYGLGMYGRIGPAADIALTTLIYFLQLPLSIWWLKHYRFGPVEWLWRSLTYGRLQTMKIPVAAGLAAKSNAS